jgi:phage terminase large subunit-like protein
VGNAAASSKAKGSTPGSVADDVPSHFMEPAESVTSTGLVGDVYDVSVDGHEFFADGILVHNCDELAAWQYPEETWSNLQFGLRLGERPQSLVTTTPRPIRLLKQLIANPLNVITRGSTFDNAENLPASALAEFRARYEGTRIGRQELHGEILDDVPGAIWLRDTIDKARVAKAPETARVVVAIDPAVTSTEGSDETGIVAAGKGVDGQYYVLCDRSCRMSPLGWANRAIVAYDEFRADRVVAEVNNGGDLVELTVRNARGNVPYVGVHASRGKRVRAEPIAALYEQGRVHHVGTLPELEDQMCTFLPEGNEDSPDRVDALVWALTFLSESGATGWLDYAEQQMSRRPR